MNDPQPTLKSRLFLLGIIALVLAIYSYPALRTAAATGSRTLPPVLAPDLSLYLNVSAMSSAPLVEPYYGTTVPPSRMGYLKFHLAFFLFSKLSALLHGHLWWSLFLWNLFWWGLLCAIAAWFFRQFLPERSSLMVIAGICWLALFNFGVLAEQLKAWTHFWSLSGFRTIELPLIRSFFPQLPTPLLILYVALQIVALQKRSWWPWIALAAIQFTAFTVFPYATLMMVGITFVAVLGLFISRSSRLPWLKIALFGFVCGVFDVLFFLHGGDGVRSGAEQSSLIRLDLSILPHRIGGIWLVLAALTVSIFFLRNLSPEIKWTLAGLGAANLFLLLGDVFFSEAALQMSHHGGYFIQATVAVLLVFLVSNLYARLLRASRAWRYVMGALIPILMMNGLLLAHGMYREFLPGNDGEAQLADAVQSAAPQAADLVLAHSLSVDDDCAWVPLLSPSHVIYCRNAQVLLSPGQNRDVQRSRQALYLYFTGKDARWVEQILNDPAALSELTRLMFLGQVATNKADRDEAAREVRTDLIPKLNRIEQKDPAVRSFFAQYENIFVIDKIVDPYFSEERLSQYFNIENRSTAGRLKILRATPR